MVWHTSFLRSLGFIDAFCIIDPVITPEIFAQTIVDDYSLGANYHAVITKAIQDQLSDYKAHSTTFGEDGLSTLASDAEMGKGVLEGEEAAWWEAWRKRARSEAGFQIGKSRGKKRRKISKEKNKDEERQALDVIPPGTTDLPMSVDEFEEEESLLQEEMRIMIKVS